MAVDEVRLTQNVEKVSHKVQNAASTQSVAS